MNYYTEENVIDILRKYKNSTLSLGDFSKENNMPEITLRKWVIKSGLQVRKKFANSYNWDKITKNI